MQRRRKSMPHLRHKKIMETSPQMHRPNFMMVPKKYVRRLSIVRNEEESTSPDFPSTVLVGYLQHTTDRLLPNCALLEWRVGI